MKIPGIIWRLIGKKVIAQVGGEVKWEASKTKMTAIVAVVIVAVEKISAAYGHPITIPPYVFEFLGAIGLWSLKDGQKV